MTTEPLTEAELRAEVAYRVAERLGLMCEDRPPTLAQLRRAKAEAAAWVESVGRGGE